MRDLIVPVLQPTRKPFLPSTPWIQSTECSSCLPFWSCFQGPRAPWARHLRPQAFPSFRAHCRQQPSTLTTWSQRGLSSCGVYIQTTQALNCSKALHCRNVNSPGGGTRSSGSGLELPPVGCTDSTPICGVEGRTTGSVERTPCPTRSSEGWSGRSPDPSSGSGGENPRGTPPEPKPAPGRRGCGARTTGSAAFPAEGVTGARRAPGSWQRTLPGSA